MSKEEWEPIRNYEGLYEVSSLGRVRSIERIVYQYNPQLDKKIPVKYPKRYLKFDKDSYGYSRVVLSKGNKQKRFLVHRLVIENFIPNQENKPCVNHINHEKHDNRLVNLEWCTYEENEKAKRIRYQLPFIARSPEGVETEWIIIRECCRNLGLQRHGVEKCLKGLQDHHRGYTFTYIRPLEK